jgi:hypothetical protein
MTAGSQILAVWRECDGGDALAVALQRSYLLLRLYVPELNCFVLADASQILAVWRECDGPDEITVALQRSYLLLRF